MKNRTNIIRLKVILLNLLLALMACKGPGSASDHKTREVPLARPVTAHHIKAIARVFAAHGGYDNWQKMKQLYYELNGQKTLVALQQRYTRLESENQTVGFDGEKVWVFPPGENANRQRMRYNLIFYFYAFPFVVGDPGVIYEEMEPFEILGKPYNAVKISYEEGIGDAPKDNYIVYSDPETNRMQWLMYTATFGSNQPSNRFRLIRYGAWQTINGLMLPQTIQWYQYSDGVVGEPGKKLDFENVSISEKEPSIENFTMPAGAQVAVLGDF